MPVMEQSQSYLTFKLENELFALNVVKVLEILEIKPITKVPKSPDFMKGVINLRGNILPVIDTRKKFDMPEAEFTIDTCIIVLSIDAGKEPLLAGALVDSVQEVLEIPETAIQSPPSIGTGLKEGFIKGMGRIDEEFIMLLDIDKVFNAEELFSMAGE
jgi:purine-binding chemotaxis protein CheW